MSTKPDITNIGLGKCLTLENLIMVVALGVAWGTLTANVNALDKRVDENKVARNEQMKDVKSDQIEMRAEVNMINRKLDVMTNNQENFKGQISGQDRKLEKILNTLEEQRR